MPNLSRRGQEILGTGLTSFPDGDGDASQMFEYLFITRIITQIENQPAFGRRLPQYVLNAAPLAIL